jgi:hypothetical protein
LTNDSTRSAAGFDRLPDQPGTATRPENPWQQALNEIKPKINLRSFQTWLQPARFVRVSGSELVIQVPNREFQSWIEENYGAALREILGRLNPPITKLRYLLPEPGQGPTRRDQASGRDNASEMEPPHNQEAEAALLGHILLDHQILATVIEDQHLKGPHFYSEAHRVIFEQILQLDAAGEISDVVTLADYLRKAGKLEKVGGIVYLSSLSDLVGLPSGEIALQHAKRVVATARQRRTINLADNLRARAFTEDPATLATEYFAELEDLSKNGGGPKVEVVEEEEPETAAGDAPSVPAICWRAEAALFREIVSPLIESNDNFLWSGFHTILGAALGKSVHTLSPRPLYANVFAVNCGGSAYSAKTTAANYCMDLLECIAPGVIVIPTADSWEGFLKDVHTQMETADRPRHGGPPSVILTLDEYNSFLLKGSVKGSKLIPAFKQAYDNPRRAFENNSISSGVRLRENPLISILASSEIDDLVDLGARNLTGGLGNRNWWLAGEPKPPMEQWGVLDPEKWSRLVANLKATVEFWWGMAASSTVESVCFTWSPTAEATWWSWYKSYRKRGQDDHVVAKLSVRDRPHVRKTALLFAALDRVSVISNEHVRAAIAAVDSLLDCRYTIFRTAGVDEKVRASIDMVQYVKERPGGVSYRTQFCPRFKRMDPREMEEKLRYLVADPWHPDRPLYKTQKPGKNNRKVAWVVMVDDEIRRELGRQRQLLEAGSGRQDRGTPWR